MCAGFVISGRPWCRPAYGPAVVALLAVSLTLAAPVAGPVAREFAYGADPFRAGWHRGADFAAAPGAAVRAACSGRVVWARRDVVTVRCGPFRVTHLPLATVAVARGERVRAGARIGALGRSRDHAGLHLGVRRAGDRFGYVDPVPLLVASPRGVPAAPRVVGRRGRPAAARGPPPRVIRGRVPRAPHSPRRGRPAPLRGSVRRRAARPLPAASAPAAVRVLAPWPAWLGLAVLLMGAVGGGVRIGLRRRRATARGARTPLTFDAADGLLRHHADLLRQRRAPPGHAYTTIGADILARHKRQRGEEVFFLTGTDEHGEPVAQAAEREGVSPKELADRNAERFKALMPRINATNDYFIRTSDPRHKRRVQEVMQAVHDNGHVYKGTYEGWYCPRCADFKTDNEVGEDNTCPIHKIPLDREREENWFFRLSSFQEPLGEAVRRPA